MNFMFLRLLANSIPNMISRWKKTLLSPDIRLKPGSKIVFFLFKLTRG